MLPFNCGGNPANRYGLEWFVEILPSMMYNKYRLIVQSPFSDPNYLVAFLSEIFLTGVSITKTETIGRLPNKIQLHCIIRRVTKNIEKYLINTSRILTGFLRCVHIVYCMNSWNRQCAEQVFCKTAGQAGKHGK